MSLVSNKSEKIFFSLDSKYEVDNKVDIILSPEFYWVRVFEMPVKTISQGKQLVPTLFEDVLESTEKLSYQIIKLENGKFLCFAYENKKIYEAIKNSGINLSFVNSIYFAQNELKNFPSFVYDNKGFIYTSDDILVKVPLNLIGEKVDINEILKNIVLSSNRVDIKLYNNLLNSKQIYVLLIAMVLLIFTNGVLIFDYKKSIDTLQHSKIELFKSSNMPNSLLQTKSIIDSYKQEVKVEVKKREALEYLLSNKDFKLISFNMDKNRLNLIYERADKKRIEEFIGKKYKISSLFVKDLNISVEVIL